MVKARRRLYGGEEHIQRIAGDPIRAIEGIDVDATQVDTRREDRGVKRVDDALRVGLRGFVLLKLRVAAAPSRTRAAEQANSCAVDLDAKPIARSLETRRSHHCACQSPVDFGVPRLDFGGKRPAQATEQTWVGSEDFFVERRRFAWIRQCLPQDRTNAFPQERVSRRQLA